MVDLHSILALHRSKSTGSSSNNNQGNKDEETPIPKISTFSEIPDVLFDRIIVDFKLNRVDILVLMYIYRRVWCFPNLHRDHAISPMMSHTEMAKKLSITIEEVHLALRRLEEYDFIRTIRAGQYFSRKYFSKELDELYNQNYDDFEI